VFEQVRHGIIQSEKDKKKSGVVDAILSYSGRQSPRPSRSTNSSFAPTQRPRPPPIATLSSPDEDGKVSDVCETFAKIIRLLLDAGSRVETREKTFGLTALDMAVLLGDMESTAMLTAAGGNPDHLMQLFAMSDLYTHIVVRPDKKAVKALVTSDKHLDINDSWSDFNVQEKTLDEVAMEQLDGYPRGYSGLTPLAGAGQGAGWADDGHREVFAEEERQHQRAGN